MNEIIKFDNVTKIFKDFWRKPKVVALKNFSFSVNEGEILGLLGPNGSGKSTTLKLILGLLYPTHGRISVFGKLPGNNLVKRFIGYLPEEDYLYSYLNAYETLDFFGKVFNLPSNIRKQRIELLFEMLGIKGYGTRPVGEYSKGMARRLGLAQSLINDPKLLILDEPTNGMDPIGSNEIKNILLDLKKKGKTILICSHLLADIESICDRIIILYQGELITEGKVDELLDSYKGEKNPLEKFFLDVVKRKKEEKVEEKKEKIYKEEKKEKEEVDKELLQKLLHKDDS